MNFNAVDVWMDDDAWLTFSICSCALTSCRVHGASSQSKVWMILACSAVICDACVTHLTSVLAPLSPRYKARLPSFWPFTAQTYFSVTLPLSSQSQRADDLISSVTEDARDWTVSVCQLCRGYMWNKTTSKLFHRLVAAREYFPTCSMSHNCRTFSAAEIILFQFPTWLRVK